MSNAPNPHKWLRNAALLGFLLPASAAFSITLDFPGSAVRTSVQTQSLASFALPVGPWSAKGIPSKSFEGQVAQMAWRIEASSRTTLEILVPLRDQLKSDGFLILYECDTQDCGGFDFRYALPVLPEPDMHVDLGDFRFLSAVRGTDQAITILVSRSSRAGYVQLMSLGVAAEGPPLQDDATLPPAVNDPPLEDITPLPMAGFGETLERTGSVTLDDLAFETGSARLDAGDFTSLSSLAEYLLANPQRAVVLVGHTDATGALAGNIALSKARAASVRDRLTSTFAVPAGQVSAEGAGYLAPRDSNLTPAGRARNRRVEVILTSTQ